MKKGNKRLIVIYAVLLIILTICYVWVGSITHLEEPEIPQYDAVWRGTVAEKTTVTNK